MVTPAPVTPGRKNPLYLGLPGRLKRARKAAGLNMAELSLRAGLAHNAVALLEAGGRVPKVDTAEKLARVLGVSACVLTFGIEGQQVFKQKIGGGRPSQGAFSIGPKFPPEKPLSCEGLQVRLVLVRTIRGLTRKDLGTAAQATGQTVANIEDGRNIPGVAMLEFLAAALGVSPCWLAYGIGQGPE